MSVREGTRLSAVEKARFADDGYLVVEGLLTQDEVGRLARRAREILGTGDSAQVVSRYAGSSRPVLQKARGLVRSEPLFRELATSPALVDVVEDLLGQEALIFRDVLVAKPAREGAAFEWHQDSAYWDVEPPALISAWVALGDVPESAGCLRVIRGSHRHPIEHDLSLGKGRRVPRPLTRLLRKAVSLAGTGDNPEGSGGNRLMDSLKRVVLVRATRYLPFLGKLGDYAVDRREIERLNLEEVSLPVRAGSVVFFHSLLLHASSPNTSDTDRLAPIISYMGRSFRFTGRGEGDFLPARAPR